MGDRPKPYIGVTGFMRSTDVVIALDCIPSNSKRLLMVGVLSSLKKLRNQPNKRPNRYPRISHISHIFLDDDRFLNLIHYNTDEPETLAAQLNDMSELGGPFLDGFQLNIAWPPYKEVLKHKNEWPNKIVLQVGKRAFDEINNSPEQLASRLAEYEDVIDYVLLDPSGGLGVPIVSQVARDYILAIREKISSVGLGIAGALSHKTLGPVAKLIKEFDLSTDAESGIRDNNDLLDTQATKLYIEEVGQICS
ncbi:MAG TPA: hypothetical protein VJH71_03290 [Candidatus Paceibacterota bacterium]